MLESLIEAANKTTSNGWRWFLGFLVGIGIVFLGWYSKRRASRVVSLEADKKLVDERAKDTWVRIKNENDTNEAKKLKEEAERLRAQAAEIDSQLILTRKEVEAAKKRITNAKDWKQLEKEAGRN